MLVNRSQSGGVGLERSCDAAPDWLRQTEPAAGVELLEAWLQRFAYRPHRHDTYAIGITAAGVQTFAYRGATHVSLPGQVVVLHPDEAHDGRAGTAAGFGYRQLYVEPSLIFAAVRTLSGRPATLPFVPDPVVSRTTLAATIRAAFRQTREPLATDDLVLGLAEGLLAADPCSGPLPLPRRLDTAAIERARLFLDAETARVVDSRELEALSGLSRYELARQFRLVVGTSPYRYSLMRRLGHARAQLTGRAPLAQIAVETGFADQAHFTRLFTAAYGLTPARYRALSASAPD